jgi:predicted ATP-grasp superfamily ATP-dependent carboligase
MFVLGEGSSDDIFKGSTLVLPAVSTGNVGQLAVDLLVNSGLAQGSIQRHGFLRSPHVLPIVGAGAYSTDTPGKICVNLEVFAGKSAVFLQQRAPVIPGREQAYAQSICEWASSAGFARVVVLGGAATPPGVRPAQYVAAIYLQNNNALSDV